MRSAVTAGSSGETSSRARSCGPALSVRGGKMAHHIPVESVFVVTCPYCGEEVEIYLEPEVRGSLVQDCEVCCNPWNVYVSPADEDGERYVQVSRGDGADLLGSDPGVRPHRGLTPGQTPRCGNLGWTGHRLVGVGFSSSRCQPALQPRRASAALFANEHRRSCFSIRATGTLNTVARHLDPPLAIPT
jgi:hypothetical protein